MARKVDIAFGLFFLYATIVQYNDPDGYLWATMYILAALPCFLSRTPGFVSTAIGVVAVIWMGTIIPDIVHEGRFNFDEIDRESLGLLIVAAYMFVLSKRRGWR